MKNYVNQGDPDGQVFRLVDQVSKINAMQPTGRVESLGDGSIEFCDVRFWYPHRPEVRVLKSLSFTILRGQSVALVGSSGSGKSTVIQPRGSSSSACVFPVFASRMWEFRHHPSKAPSAVL